jgi:hypothetical protein
MATIFISYRREDSSGYAGRLHDRLVSRFGSERMFRDIDNIEPGVDFVEVINRVLAQCGVMLVVVGPRWLTCADSAGRRRIDNASDYHRMEIEAGLKRMIRVIPVLVDGADMPAESDLPDSMKAFARRNAIEITDKRFGFDTGKLPEAIDHALKDFERAPVGPPPKATEVPHESPGPKGGLGQRKGIKLIWALAIVCVVAVGAIIVLTVLPPKPTTTQPPNGSIQPAQHSDQSLKLAVQPPKLPPTAPGTQPKTVPTVDPRDSLAAEQRERAWTSANLTGHYHDQATSARVVIRQNGAQYRLFVDAPQAKFDCDLEFGPDGRPESASACKVVKYDYAGKVQTDVHWWTNDRIRFACEVSGQKEVCRGSYILHFGGTGDPEPWPSERRIMRIERPLN